MSNLYDGFMSDTVGLVYRAGTGSVDPWTKSQIVDDATAANIQAGADPATAAADAQSAVDSSLKNFTLGGDDPIGADPSQAKLSLPSGTSFGLAAKSLVNDDGSGCSITNMGGCIPAWLPYVVVGAGVIALLWVLRPYVGLVARQ